MADLADEDVAYEVSLMLTDRQKLISRLEAARFFSPKLAIFLKPKAEATNYMRLVEEELPWDRMAVDVNGCYHIQLARKDMPSPPTTPPDRSSLPAGRPHMRLPEGSIKVSDLVAKLARMVMDTAPACT